MTSRTTARFRTVFAQLPVQVQRQAREAYKLFWANSHHPSLRFKQVHPTRPIYSAPVGRDYRTVGVREGNEIIWFWIGSHADYEQLISRL